MLNECYTILIAEDFEENRMGLKLMLELSGYDVIEARDGKEALELIQNAPPDIVLMDISLPIIDGLEASRQIRSNPNTASLPIIIVSAHDTPEIQETITSLGHADYISKPIEFDDLMNKIHYHLLREDR